MVELRGRDLLSLKDFTSEELRVILDIARELKWTYKRGEVRRILESKTIALLFEKPSLRTRSSFEVAVAQLGGTPMYMWSETMWEEPTKDVALVLSGYVDGIVARLKTQKSLEELAHYAPIPVINALTDMYHPCQVLADIMTIAEKKGRLEGIKVAYTWAYCHRARPAGVCHSLMVGCSKLGINLTIACPEGYEPTKEVLKIAEEEAKRSGSQIEVVNDMKEAVKNADVVYAKNYTPPNLLGKKEEEDMRKAYKDWIVTSDIMKLAKKDAIFMHCMPVYREEEVTSEVVDGPQSVIYEEAENRLHAQRAALALLIP